MKYKWLEKYLDFFLITNNDEINTNNSKLIITSFFADCEYYLAYLAYSKERFDLIKDEELSSLSDADLELYLYYTLTECKTTSNLLEIKIVDHSIFNIIKEMLKVPDTNLPISDYTFKETIDEVIGLQDNLPTKDKIKNNNVAACYSCHNVFYVDKIKNVDREHMCLCPYCLMSTLYFDNDYIPMNSSFIRLAYLYYQDEYKLNNIVEILNDKIKFKIKSDKTNCLYLDVSNNLLVPNEELAYIKEDNKYVMCNTIILNGKTSLEEDNIGSLIYKTLVLADYLKVNKLEVSFNEKYYDYDKQVTAINFILATLTFIIKHYFTGIEEISIITKNKELVKTFKNILSDLRKNNTKK